MMFMMVKLNIKIALNKSPGQRKAYIKVLQRFLLEDRGCLELH